MYTHAYTNFSLLKEFPDLFLRLPRNACDNFSCCQLEEREVQLSCNSMRNQRLPTPGRAMQEKPTRRGNTQMRIHLWMA